MAYLDTLAMGIDVVDWFCHTGYIKIVELVGIFLAGVFIYQAR